MKVVIKNFFRKEHTELTVKSILHFMPEAEIYVLHLCTNNLQALALVEGVPTNRQNVAKTKYFGMGSAVANAANGLFFSEGYNIMAEMFKDCDEKVLMLAEDHFFTTGATLNELQETEFDIAYAPWDSSSDTGANGSILCVRPSRVKFPMEEKHIPIEGLLQSWINSHDVNKHRLSTRAALNYHGDGFYTNSADEIRAALEKACIV